MSLLPVKCFKSSADNNLGRTGKKSLLNFFLLQNPNCQVYQGYSLTTYWALMSVTVELEKWRKLRRQWLPMAKLVGRIKLGWQWKSESEKVENLISIAKSNKSKRRVVVCQFEKENIWKVKIISFLLEKKHGQRKRRKYLERKIFFFSEWDGKGANYV